MSGPVFVGGMQLDLLADVDPTARTSDIATSHTAAAIAGKRAPTNRERALLALLKHGPLTDFDLSTVTGLAQTSVGVRRGELTKAGLVCAVPGATRPSWSGSPAQVWRLTAAGEALAKEMRS